MTLRLVLAWLHLLALAVGLAGVWARARALDDSLRNPEDPRAIRRALVGDTWWGIAVVAWLATGLWRVFAGSEKPPSYYVASYAFAIKMGLFMVVLALEIWPSTTLMRWRRKKSQPDARDVGRIEIISYVQCALVAGMALASVAMARGYGAPAAVPTTPSDSAAVADSIQASAPAAGVDRTADDPPIPLPSGTEVSRRPTSISSCARSRCRSTASTPRRSTATSSSGAEAARASTRRSTSWRRAAPPSAPPRPAAC